MNVFFHPSLMFFFRKQDALHKKISSIAFVFALIPTFIWFDMMYALFRENVLVPFYYNVSDMWYITIMLIFPVIALILATWGHVKNPVKTRDYSLFTMFLSIVLVVLMALAASPLFD